MASTGLDPSDGSRYYREIWAKLTYLIVDLEEDPSLSKDELVTLKAIQSKYLLLFKTYRDAEDKRFASAVLLSSDNMVFLSSDLKDQ